MTPMLRYIFAAVFVCMTLTQAHAAELIMFDRDGCPWCAKWHAEIGVNGYAAAPESASASLHIYKFGQAMPDNVRSLSRTVIGTPTFVLMRDGEEIDRIIGYPGKQVFFGKLQLMIDKLSGADKQYKTIIVQ